MVDILLYQSGNEWAFGRSLSARSLAMDARRLAEESEDEALVGVANYRLASACLAIGQYESAAEAGAAGFEQLRPQASELMRFGGLVQTFVGSFGAFALAELGRFDEAVKIGREAFDTACQSGHAYSISVSCFGIGHAALLRGDVESALGPLEEGLRQIEVHGVGATVPWVSGRSAYAMALAGRTDEVEPLIKMTTEESATEFSASMMHPYAFIWLARACLTLARYEDAACFIARAHQTTPGVDPDGAVVGWAHWLDAEVARLTDGDAAAAEASIANALSATDERGMRPLCAHCLATRAFLRSDESEIEQARSLAQELGMKTSGR